MPPLRDGEPSISCSDPAQGWEGLGASARRLRVNPPSCTNSSSSDLDSPWPRLRSSPDTRQTPDKHPQPPAGRVTLADKPRQGDRGDGFVAVQKQVAFMVHPKTQGRAKPLASSPSSQTPGAVALWPRRSVHPCFPCSSERVLQQRRRWEEDGTEEDSACCWSHRIYQGWMHCLSPCLGVPCF